MNSKEPKEKKLVKVTMEYDNGEVQTLKGKEAQEWIDWLNGSLMMSYIHGGTGKQFNWKVQKKAKK